MNIQQNSVVTFHYRLTTDENEFIEDSTGGEPLVYLHGYGNLISGMEKALEGKSVNESFSVTIPPEDAYGENLDDLVQIVPIDAFEGVDELAVGLRFTATTDQGDVPVVIRAITEEKVTVDGNHPLAGKTLNFSVEIKEIREASAEEIEHGHVHGAGGHHH